MRSVGYIVNKEDSSVYPFVVTVGNVNCRLDILNRGSIDPIILSTNCRYKSKDILQSIIYTKLTQIQNTAGLGAIYKQSIHLMSEDTKYAMLVDGRIFDTELKSFSILGVAQHIRGGSTSKVSGLTYARTTGEHYLIKSEIKYSANLESKILDLQYFVDTKDLKLETKDYKCLDTYDKVQEYVNSVDWTKIIYTAKDTETNGIEFYRGTHSCHIVGMSHSYKDKQGVYIPFRYRGQNVLDVKKVFEIMRPIYDNTRQIFQNGPFDKRVFASEGIEERIDEELTVLQRLINPSEMCPIALKYVARVLLNEDTIELDEILGSNFNANLVEYIPMDLMTVYACSDTDYTRRIFLLLYCKISETTKRLYEEDMKSYRIVKEADWLGIPVRDKTNKELIESTDKDIQLMYDVMIEYITKEAKMRYVGKLIASKGVDINKLPEEKVIKLLESKELEEIMKPLLRGVRSSKFDLDYAADRYKIFYELLDYPRIRYTAGGALSTGKDFYKDLSVYMRDKPVEVLKEDLMSSNGEHVLFEKDEVNSRVFPLGYMFETYSTKKHEHDIYKKLRSMQIGEYSFSENKFSGTVTGRVTNMIQTIPKYAKGVIGFEEDSKYGLVDFDFDQVELRCAHNEAIRLWESLKELPEVKNNPNHIVNTYDWHKIVNIFNSYWSDVHKEMTAGFNGCSPSEITKKQRDAGKAINFATLYGGTEYSASKNEMKFAKTLEAKKQLLDYYAQEINKLFCTNLHLYNYFNTSKSLALEPIPEDEIPYNIKSRNVGKTQSRSGRVRYYDLNNIVSKSLKKIMNAGRNQLIQSYARDIVFKAIQMITERLKEEGYTNDDFYSGIFIHDEDVIIYDKTKINPLWIAVIIHKYAKMRFEGSPIYYYCSVVICNNWSEGKNDKYEIPKELLDSLSDDIRNYPILETRNHRDYIYDIIVKFYREKTIELLIPLITKTDDKSVVNLDNLDIDKNYFLLGKLALYTKEVAKNTDSKEINTIANILCDCEDWVKENNIILEYKGVQVPVERTSKAQLLETEEQDSEEFDIDSFMKENEELLNAETFVSESQNGISTTSEFGTSYEAIYSSYVDKKTLAELNSKLHNIKMTAPAVHHLLNVLVEPFTNQVTINLSPLGNKKLSLNSFKKINNILIDISKNTVKGYDVYYMLNGGIVEGNMIVPKNMKFEKFDNFIESLRE